MIKFHGISMPEGAALSWPLSDIVIRPVKFVGISAQRRSPSYPAWITATFFQLITDKKTTSGKL